jgi:hypothetical protein
MRFVSVVVQRHAIELFERVCDFSARRGESGVQWHTLQHARRVAEAFVYATAVATYVDTM